MTVVLLVVSIAFTLAMLVQILLPFSVSREEQLSFELLDEELRQIEILVNRKVALVQTLRDLEYDWETDKISEKDYQRFKRSCERQAVAIMRRLDAIHGGRDWQNDIDRAIDERVASNLFVSEESPSPELGESADDHDGTDDALVCANCATPLEDDDLFCGKCGTPVASAEDQDLPDERPPLSDFDPLTNTSSPSEITG